MVEALESVIAQFVDNDGVESGPPLQLPSGATPEQLALLLNHLLKNEDDKVPFVFSLGEIDIVSSLSEAMLKAGLSVESAISIVYSPQAVFKVRTVSRCTSSLTGHSEAVLSVCFSPDGKSLASASGDTTVRTWDLGSETPKFTFKGHKNWVLHVAWSPDSQMLVSGGMDNLIIVWNPVKGVAIGEPIKSHTQCITSLAWEPMHRNIACNRFVSSSKDGTAKVWDATLRKNLFTFAQHTAPIMCVKWGGDGMIYTASRDKTIKMWSSETGQMIRSLDGHAHWINHLSLSTDFVLRTGPYDHTCPSFGNKQAAFDAACIRYSSVLAAAGGIERLASGSDDFTLFLWEPSVSKKPIARMTGHQQPVTHLSFSPDGKYLASASFDKSVKLWDAKTGVFITTLRGHVNAVYQVCWSSDSRQILSGSRDSTLKCWDVRTKKMKSDLPGHADEVYSVDWSPSGDRVASGSKDRLLKIWKQ